MDKPHAIEFKPDGKVMYVIQSKSGSVGVEQFNLTTAWDIETLEHDTNFSISDDVQIRACYFDDRYVFDEEGFHNDQGEETWLEWWQGMDPEGCGAPVFPHDGSSNPAGYVFDDEAGTLTLNGVGSYIGLPKAVNGAELTSPDQAPESVTYQIYMQESPRMMTLVIEVGTGVFWTCLLYTSPSPRDVEESRMPSSA